METKKTLSEKAEMIQSFANILDKYCSDRHDVYYVVRALREWSEFMANQRFIHNTDIMRMSRTIEELIIEKKYVNHISTFKNLSEAACEATILAGQNAEAINLINKMDEDISKNILS